MATKEIFFLLNKSNNLFLLLKKYFIGIILCILLFIIFYPFITNEDKRGSEKSLYYEIIIFEYYSQLKKNNQCQLNINQNIWNSVCERHKNKHNCFISSSLYNDKHEKYFKSICSGMLNSD
jgi:hypothetical protein